MKTSLSFVFDRIRSFKLQTEYRGHKGVGATFLAYGFSFLKLQSKQEDVSFAAVLRQGRAWAEDSSGSIPRPKFEEIEFSVPRAKPAKLRALR